MHRRSILNPLTGALFAMSRPKEFDPRKALDRAMRQFWNAGYEGTSVQDLVKATGLNRSSLYETFGCKHDLYLAALDRYREQEAKRLSSHLERDGSPLAHLRQVFEQAGQACTEDGRGCFIVNATVERARSNEATGRRAAASMRAMERAFAEAVRRAQQAGEVPRTCDPAAAGRFLANAYRGLKVTARLRPGDAAPGDVIETTLAALQKL